MLSKIVGWIFTPLFALVFFLILVVFHPVQMIALSISYHAHKKVVDLMVGCLLYSLKITGASIQLNHLPGGLPTGRPLILVSNHQSMFDIPLIGWMLRKHHPKYIAKIELSKGVPSISYNIRNGGSIAIDRKNSKQSIPAIKEFAEYLEANKYAGCIFPEGSRARDGKMKPFKPTGLNVLLKYSPGAVIVPIVIEGAWELMRYGVKPVPFGVKISCTVLEPIEREGKSSEEILKETERRIRKHLGQEISEEEMNGNYVKKEV